GVLEDRMIEIVRRGHRGFNAPVANRPLEVATNLVALGSRRAEGDDVVVVELEAVTIPLGQPLDAFHCREFRSSLVAKRITAAVLQAPQAKGKLVVPRRRVIVGWHKAPIS